jgi:hypothetical protein
MNPTDEARAKATVKDCLKVEIKDYSNGKDHDQVMIWINDREYCIECVPRHLAETIRVALHPFRATGGEDIILTDSSKATAHKNRPLWYFDYMVLELQNKNIVLSNPEVAEIRAALSPAAQIDIPNMKADAMDAAAAQSEQILCLDSIFWVIDYLASRSLLRTADAAGQEPISFFNHKYEEPSLEALGKGADALDRHMEKGDAIPLVYGIWKAIANAAPAAPTPAEPVAAVPVDQETQSAKRWFNERIEYFSVKHPQQIAHIKTINAALSGSLGQQAYVAEQIKRMPSREEMMGGQRHKYLDRDEVIGWLNHLSNEQAHPAPDQSTVPEHVMETLRFYGDEPEYSGKIVQTRPFELKGKTRTDSVYSDGDVIRDKGQRARECIKRLEGGE